MEIPLIVSIKVQLILNILAFLFFIYLSFKTLKLVLSVKKENIDQEEKKEKIKRLGITLVIFVTLFVLINIFFQLDPLNIIDDLIQIPL